MIDIANYLISRNKWEAPLDAREAILTLGDHDVLDDLFAAKIAGLAGFRNILVHGYLSIDRAIVHHHLKRLEDFRLFQKQILEYLNKPSSPSSD